MNACQKGKRGEREWRDVLREHGYTARRGQQFSGSEDSPDVVSSIPIHWEVKRVEKLNLNDACSQAARDSGGKAWAVAHRRNDCPWLVTVSAELFFSLVRGDYAGVGVDTGETKV